MLWRVRGCKNTGLFLVGEKVRHKSLDGLMATEPLVNPPLLMGHFDMLMQYTIFVQMREVTLFFPFFLFR